MRPTLVARVPTSSLVYTILGTLELRPSLIGGEVSTAAEGSVLERRGKLDSLSKRRLRICSELRENESMNFAATPSLPHPWTAPAQEAREGHRAPLQLVVQARSWLCCSAARC